MEESKELIYSKQVMEMLTVANEYCLYIDECKTQTLENLMIYLSRILPLMYLKGSLLPDVVPSDESANERFVSEEHWENVYNAVNSLTGDLDHYWYIPFPAEKIPHPERGSLADNVSDIYQDMKDFILLYQKPHKTAKENAVAECRKLFHEHWGPSLLSATYTLHKIQYAGDTEAEKDFNPFNF